MPARSRLPQLRQALSRAVLLVAALLLSAAVVHAKGIGDVEDEFEKAIRKVTPATVICLPKDKDTRLSGVSSGVIVSRKGLVLSDGDAGFYWTEPPPKGQRVWSDEIEIRIPNLRGRGFKTYEAEVVKRNRDLDTCLMRIKEPPSSGFAFLLAGNSDDLRVGDFTFTMGNAFRLADEVPPTLTAGIVACLVPLEGEGEGLYDRIYTSAAVNPGVNGGPLVDVEGRLVGTVSSAVNPRENGGNQPFQFLGRVIPIERLRAFYGEVEGAEGLFKEPKTSRPKSRKAAILETVFHRTARRSYDAVVSVSIDRKTPLQMLVPAGGGKTAQLARYTGPVSGVLVSQDGHILTSLYNLTNTTALVQAMANAPDAMKLKTGLASIEKLTAHMPDGRAVEAKLVSRHEGIGLALLKADLEPAGEGGDRPYGVELLEPAPADVFEAGRIVLALGNPFGETRLPDPLLAVGVLSKRHDEASSKPWAGQWQTDAGGTDANCGGAAVDLRGRLIGIMTLWFPPQHGRNSGINFIAPWSQIEAVLPAMKDGRSFARPFMGVGWDEKRLPQAFVKSVMEGKAAMRAGMKVGDRIVRVDDQETETIEALIAVFRRKWAGDVLKIWVRRGEEDVELVLKLGERD